MKKKNINTSGVDVRKVLLILLGDGKADGSNGAASWIDSDENEGPGWIECSGDGWSDG